jgi:hypothetical protein
MVRYEAANSLPLPLYLILLDLTFLQENRHKTSADSQAHEDVDQTWVSTIPTHNCNYTLDAQHCITGWKLTFGYTSYFYVYTVSNGVMYNLHVNIYL